MFQHEKFRERVKALRVESNDSMESLGHKMGVTKQAVSRWESGARMPAIDILCNLAEYFGVTVDYLLGQSDER